MKQKNHGLSLGLQVIKSIPKVESIHYREIRRGFWWKMIVAVLSKNCPRHKKGPNATQERNGDPLKGRTTFGEYWHIFSYKNWKKKSFL